MKNKNLKAEPTLIKNPFVCNSSKQIRLGLDKDPRNFKGDTQFIKDIPLENGNTILNNEIDNKLSYMIGNAPMNEKEDLTFIQSYDYEVPVEKLNENKEEGDKNYHTEALPLSFINIQCEDEGIEWYAKHHPKIPTDLLPIIARYHWGEPITKKAIKNEKKKITKEIEKEGLSISYKKVELSFD